MRRKQNKGEGVSFDLEEDAEELFRQAVENVSPSAKATCDEDASPRPSKARKPGAQTWDLHGMRLAEAKAFLRNRVAQCQSQGGAFRVKIITGKGRHSADGAGVLVNAIHAFVASEFAASITRLDENPGDARLDGLPLRGHFEVHFRF